MATIPMICCRCETTYGSIEVSYTPEPDAASHGLCQSCAKGEHDSFARAVAIRDQLIVAIMSRNGRTEYEAKRALGWLGRVARQGSALRDACALLAIEYKPTDGETISGDPDGVRAAYIYALGHLVDRAQVTGFRRA
jgi:hypothetical protein